MHSGLLCKLRVSTDELGTCIACTSAFKSSVSTPTNVLMTDRQHQLHASITTEPSAKLGIDPRCYFLSIQLMIRILARSL